jgi:hypothetical protein
MVAEASERTEEPMSTKDEILCRVAELLQQLEHLQTEDRLRLTALFKTYIESIARNI